jgi:diaminopimelate epimerase
MAMPFFKYQATGNDFIMIDDRQARFDLDRQAYIARLCDRRFGIGADGLILLRQRPGFDFQMVYFNADGREGTFCGNGGRATVKFAHSLGLFNDTTHFIAADGPHKARVLPNGQVVLHMGDVAEISPVLNGFFLNTGSPHYVLQVEVLDQYPVFEQGKALRYHEAFAPKGTNVNFIAPKQGSALQVRTYERGVEDETYSCGTGVTAAALVAARMGYQSPVTVETKGGTLEVGFRETDGAFTAITLAGPALEVFTGTLPEHPLQ